MLLEREAEVGTLDAFVSGAARPGPRLGLIEGPAGIGKTTLLAEARRIAESDGIRVLSARGSTIESDFPYGVVRQLFEPALADPAVRKRAFAGAAEAARPVFEGEGADQVFAILHGLYWLTLNVAGEEPLLLAIDDLHWADHPSLRFVAYLVHRLEELPVLVASGVRPNEPGSDQAMIAELAADPLTVNLRPGPLGAPAVAELIGDRLAEPPDPEFAAACHRATGGNPLLLYELLRALAAEGVAPHADRLEMVNDLGPRAASRAVLVRLARLPGEAARVARALAVLGDGAELWAAAELSGIGEQEAADATGALAASEILRPDPPLGFVHPLVRDAVYLELSPGERELQHARAAELLRDGGAPAEQVAAHLLLAPGVEGEWVARTLRDAAAAAQSRGAGESAIPYLSRALEEPLDAVTRAQVLRDLGQAEVQHIGPAATEHLAQAYEALTEPRARAEVAMLLSWALIFTGRAADARAVAARAHDEAPAEPADLRQGLLALELFTGYFGAGDHDRLAELERYRSIEVDSVGAAMLAGAAAYDWGNMIGPMGRIVPLVRELLEAPELFVYDQGMFWCGATLILVYAEEQDGLDTWDRILADVYRGGSLFVALTANLWGGYTAMLWGRLDEALERFNSAQDQGLLWGAGERIDHVPAAFIAQILVEKGEVAGAREALEIARDRHPARGHFAGNLWRRAEVEVLLAEGRLDEALAAADALGEAIGRLDNPAGHPWRTLKAEVLDRLGRSDEAAELAEAELELARAWGAPGPIGRALRVAGTARREEGIDQLRDAVEVLEGSQLRLELARALHALGAAVRRDRKPTEAREPLQRALELAVTCGATALEESARVELRASGARPRRDALGGVESLTPSERRVADLAAAGRTNREIAQELYVTPKTVEVHLSNTYRKLEISGRRDLAGALAG